MQQAPVVVATVLLYVLGAQGVVGALVAAMLTVLLMVWVITAPWKVSVHSAVAVVGSTYGAWAPAAGVAVPVIGCSRVRLWCHAVAQVMVGALMGAGVAGAVFCFLR
jgi:hypothetical protein